MFDPLWTINFINLLLSDKTVLCSYHYTASSRLSDQTCSLFQSNIISCKFNIYRNCFDKVLLDNCILTINWQYLVGPVHSDGNKARKLYLVIQSNQCSELPTPPPLIEFNICYKIFITSLLQIVFSLIIIIKSFHEDELSLKLLVHHNTDFNRIIRKMIVLKQTARRRLLGCCCCGSSLPLPSSLPPLQVWDYHIPLYALPQP